MTYADLDQSLNHLDIKSFDATWRDGSLLKSVTRSEHTHDGASSPPTTPIVHGGPRLLPRIRFKDQTPHSAERENGHGYQRSRSGTASTVMLTSRDELPDPQDRSLSPGYPSQLPTPASDYFIPSSRPALQTVSSYSFSGTPPRPSLQHGRSISTSAVPTYTRKLFSSHSNGSVLSRYDTSTCCDTAAAAAYKAAYGARTQTVSALSHLMPLPMSISLSRLASPANSRSHSALPLHAHHTHTSFSPPTPESVNRVMNIRRLSVLSHVSTSTTTVLDYLNSPNPSPSLVRQVIDSKCTLPTHFWYDVRNVRHWSAFSVQTLCSHPAMTSLLQMQITRPRLPTLPSCHETPETLSHLQSLLTTSLIATVNHTLQIISRELNLTRDNLLIKSVRLQNSTASPSQSDFISLPASGSRPHVVGIVRSYTQWNSSMCRTSSSTSSSRHASDAVRYLTALSTLHHHMRRQGCRYGFLITEVELVCVRYGGDDGAPVPLFGFLEVSDPVRLATTSPGTARCGSNGSSESSEGPLMTAALALTWLHIMASSSSSSVNGRGSAVPGEWDYRLSVGDPAALTRQKMLKDRDAWMPRPHQAEQRLARRSRGWVWPEDKLSRKELGGGRKR